MMSGSNLDNKNTNATAVLAVGDMEEDVSPPATRQQRPVKAGLLFALAIIVLYVVLDYTIPGLGFVNDILISFLEWVEDNPGLGAVAFAAVYIFTTVCFIPGSLLTLGAGLVFGRALGVGLGVLVGSVAVLAGATIGAILAFLLGRFVLREQAQGLFNKFKVLKAVDRAIETQGLKLVLLLRLSPVVPFSAFNYVMGVTAVHFRDYALGCLGFIPGTVAYVFIGTTASSLLGDDSEDESDDDSSSFNVQLIVIFVGAIATVIAVVLISIYAKRALNEVLEEDMEEERKADEAAQMEGGGVGMAAAAAMTNDVGAHAGTTPLLVDHPVRSHV